MSGFIEWLEDLNKKNTKVRAVLRRSLAFDPGTYVSAYPYVESFVKDENNTWRRDIHYLVAGLWAAHWREGRHREPNAIRKSLSEVVLRKREVAQHRTTVHNLAGFRSWPASTSLAPNARVAQGVSH